MLIIQREKSFSIDIVRSLNIKIVILKKIRLDMIQQIIQSNYNNELEKEINKLFHRLNLPLHFNKTGYNNFTNYQRMFLIIIYRRENKPIRDFLAWLAESKWVSWLDLKYVPSKSTFHDWLGWFDTELVRE